MKSGTGHLNRKINRGTLGHQENPLVIAYNKQYNIGTGLVFQVLKTYGDCEYSHNLCEFIAKKKDTIKISGIKFVDIIKDFQYEQN